MQDVSEKWSRALTTDHGADVRVTMLYDGDVVAENIPYVSGSISVDRGSDTRRSLSLSLADPTVFPQSPTDTYAVYGQRLYVEGGITYLDGSSERVPLGVFVLTSIGGNIHTGPMELEAAGLETLLKRSVWETATSTVDTTAISFIRSHVEDSIPGADVVDRSTRGENDLATKTWDARSDKWSALSEVATSIGAELYTDANGTFVLADIPDPTDLTVDPVWEVAAGEGGVMVSADVQLTADDVFNRVVATGENSEDDEEPVEGEARITDEDDPLRYGGPFGRVTKAYSSSLLVSTADATDTAISLLRKYRAPNRTVTLDSVPNFALDAGDRIRVVYGTIPPEIHIVHSFELGLSPDDGGFQISTVSGRDSGDD